MEEGWVSFIDLEDVRIDFDMVGEDGKTVFEVSEVAGCGITRGFSWGRIGAVEDVFDPENAGLE